MWFKLFFWYQKLKRQWKDRRSRVTCPHCHQKIHYMLNGTMQYTVKVCPACLHIDIRYHLEGFLPKYRLYPEVFV